jgi:hypothetical protein
MENNMEFPKKLKRHLSYDPAIPLLGIYLMECESGYNEDTCTSVYCTIHNRKAMETAKMPHY